MDLSIKRLMGIKFEDCPINCPIHGKTEGVRLTFSDGSTKCSCKKCDELQETLEKKSLDEVQVGIDDRRRIQRLKRLNVQKEYWNKSIDDYKPQSKMQGKYLNAVKAMIKSGRGKIIVLGPNGTGKTMLACEALKALGGIRYTMFELSVEVRSQDRTDKDVIAELIDAPLLVIDEIGRSKGSEFETNLLSYVLDRRHSDDLPIIVLSNCHKKSRCEKGGCDKCLENYLDEDLLSRFSQDGVIISFEDNLKDWRKEHRNIDWR